MKAYYVREPYEGWSVVVFAESAGQAKMEAIGSEYLGDYVEYLGLRARRVPKLDDKYRGHTVMEWEFDMQDRIDLYEADVYRCGEEYTEEWMCKECPLKDRCEEYKEWYGDEQED